jgi:hypothetical protein
MLAKSFLTPKLSLTTANAMLTTGLVTRLGTKMARPGRDNYKKFGKFSLFFLLGSQLNDK